jgi:hypothetical protein
MTNDGDIIRPHLPHPAERGLTPEQIKARRKSLKEAEEAEQVRVELLAQQDKAKKKRIGGTDGCGGGEPEQRYGRANVDYELPRKRRH